MDFKKEINIKTLVSNQKIDSEQMRKINTYALKDLSPDDVYIRQFLLAHNAVDRDQERFSENLLEDFRRTLPGKSVLQSHLRQELPKGLFFDAATDKISPEGFKLLTGEEARLPENIQTVKVLFGWVYFLKSSFNDELISLIDGGIIRFVSIGFHASDLIEVENHHGDLLYREYVPPGEALEGSIVWLGAQPGAMIKTSMRTSEKSKEDSPIDWRKKNPLVADDESFQTEDKGGEDKDWREKNPLVPDDDEEKEDDVKINVG
jgi:hypothetical protein